MARGRGSGRRGGAHVDGDSIGGQLVASAEVLSGESYDRQSHLLLESIADGFLIVDEEGRLTYVNSAVEQFLGMRREALLGREAWEVFPEDIGLPFFWHCQRVMAEHIPIQFDARHQPPELWLDLRLSPLPDGGVAAYVSDITERKRQDQLVHAEQAPFRAAFDHAAIGMMHVATDGRLLSVNDHFCAMLDRSREELLQLSVADITHADDRAAEKVQMRRLLRGERASYHMEKRYLRHNGTFVWCNLTVSLVKAAGGAAMNPVYFSETIEDITQRKRQERVLTRRLADLEHIFDIVPDAVTVYDAKGRMVRVNAAARALLGLETKPATLRMRGSTGYQQRLELLDESLRPLLPGAEPALRILRGETFSGNHTVDVRARTFDGRLLDLTTSGAPIRAPEGRIQGGVVITRDVTQQRAHERRTRRALQSLLKMTALVVGQDADKALWREATTSNPHDAIGGTLVQLEPIMRRLAESTGEVLGCERVSFTAVDAETELLRPLTHVAWSLENASHYRPEGGQRQVYLLDIMSPPLIERLRAGEVVVLDQNARAPGLRQRATTVEMIVPLQIGTRFLGMLSLDFSSTPQLDEYEILAWAEASAQLASLIMERGRLLYERTQARASELAQHTLVERMDALVELAGHDLRSPLTSAKLAVQYCLHGAERLAAALRGSMREWVSDEAMALATTSPRRLGEAKWALERMERMVRRLLDASRIRSGNLKLDAKRVDLRTIIHESIRAMRLTDPTRMIQFVEPRWRAEAVSVLADAAQIDEVVTNYLTNALRYSSSVPDRPVEVTLLIQKGFVRVEVRDEGQGIPPDKLERIWHRFERADEERDKLNLKGGLGLGLYICRSIIELHRGKVGVESHPGRGSTFWFTLPLAPQSQRGSTPIRISGLVFGF